MEEFGGPAEEIAEEPGEFGDAGRSFAGVAVVLVQGGDVFGETALEVTELGAVNDSLRIHQRRRGHHQALRLNVAKPRQVIGERGVFGGEGRHGHSGGCGDEDSTAERSSSSGFNATFPS